MVPGEDFVEVALAEVIKIGRDVAFGEGLQPGAMSMLVLPGVELAAQLPGAADDTAEAAVAAVRQWRYEPTLVDGEPVSILMTVTINFQLRGDEARP